MIYIIHPVESSNPPRARQALVFGVIRWAWRQRGFSRSLFHVKCSAIHGA
jgi:hypothetical protein